MWKRNLGDTWREQGTLEKPKQTHTERGNVGVSWCRPQHSSGVVCGALPRICSESSVFPLSSLPGPCIINEAAFISSFWVICSYNHDFKYHMNNSENYFTVVR